MRHTGEEEVLFGQRWCWKRIREEKESDATYNLKVAILASAERHHGERRNRRQLGSKAVGQPIIWVGLQKCVAESKPMSSASTKGLIPVPRGAKELPGEVRVAWMKWVEHIEKYKLTQQEYTGPQGNLKKERASFGHVWLRRLPWNHEAEWYTYGKSRVAENASDLPRT